MVISNHAYGYLNSPELAVQPSTTYHVNVWLRGEIDSEESAGKWKLRAYYYPASPRGKLRQPRRAELYRSRRGQHRLGELDRTRRQFHYARQRCFRASPIVPLSEQRLDRLG